MAIKSEIAIALRNLFHSDEFKLFQKVWASYKEDYVKQLIVMPTEGLNYDKRMAHLQGTIAGMDTLDKVQLNVEQELRRLNDKKLAANE